MIRNPSIEHLCVGRTITFFLRVGGHTLAFCEWEGRTLLRADCASYVDGAAFVSACMARLNKPTASQLQLSNT